jgi:hypothetical protein
MDNNFVGFDESEFEDLPFDDETVEEWLQKLPKLKKKKHEFLIKINWEDENEIYVAVREPFWHEVVDAEAQAFRYKDVENYYLSGEAERKAILRKAILWVAVTPSCEFLTNQTGDILNKLNFDFVEAIWAELQPRIYLGATEAAALYNAASKYFNGEAQISSPVPSIIIEVDMMLKFGGMSRKELNKLTSVEMEKMQTVFMARSESLGFGKRETVSRPPRESAINISDDDSDLQDNMKKFLSPWS